MRETSMALEMRSCGAVSHRLMRVERALRTFDSSDKVHMVFTVC